MSNLILENEQGERMELGFSFKEMYRSAALEKKATALSYAVVKILERDLRFGISPTKAGERLKQMLEGQPKALRERAEKILSHNLVALHCMPSLALHSPILEVIELRIKVREGQQSQSSDTPLTLCPACLQRQTGQSDSR